MREGPAAPCQASPTEFLRMVFAMVRVCVCSYTHTRKHAHTRREHTNNPVQKPNFRGHAGTKARTRVYKPPTVLQDHQGRENKRASVDLARAAVDRNKPRSSQKTAPVQLSKILELLM